MATAAKNETGTEKDDLTNDMFSAGDRKTLLDALSNYEATLQRKVNTEKRAQIKEIYEIDLSEVRRLALKIGATK